MGLFLPLPCPQTARPSRCKGARNAREPATNPCSATGASGSHPRSFASHAKVGRAGANGKSGREAAAIARPNDFDICTKFALGRTAPVSSGMVTATYQTGTYPFGKRRRSISKAGNTTAKNGEPAICSSGGSPLAVPGVDLGHEDGSERELPFPSFPRQFAQIAACGLNRRTSL